MASNKFICCICGRPKNYSQLSDDYYNYQSICKTCYKTKRFRTRKKNHYGLN